MKAWTSKKTLRAKIEALTTENHKLQQQVDTNLAALKQWVRTATDYSLEIVAANKHIEVLQGRLSKFDRQRGVGGKYVKKTQ